MGAEFENDYVKTKDEYITLVKMLEKNEISKNDFYFLYDELLQKTFREYFKKF